MLGTISIVYKVLSVFIAPFEVQITTDCVMHSSFTWQQQQQQQNKVP